MHKNAGHTARALSAGVLLSVTIAMAAMFVSEHYGGPVMLYALLLGIAFDFLSEEPRFGTGIGFSAATILRIGVACLGLRITLGDITDLGWATVTLVACGLVSTILVGWALGRSVGLRSDHAVLSAGAVAICGASAALAIAAVLPAHKDSEQNTIMTVIGVTVLSTLAMVLYPILTSLMGFPDILAGIFIGATVHDVAQVVGAGYLVSETAGDTSAVVKLMRVTFLAPVVLTLALAFRQASPRTEDGQGVALVPAFLIGFIAIVIVNSIGLVPEMIVEVGSEFSRWCLVIAIAALGCKTSPGALVKVGARPFLVLFAQSVYLAAFALIGLALFF